MKKFFTVFALSACAWCATAAQETGAALDSAARRDVARLSPDYFIPHRFDGKTIVVTGGARGMGRWTAARAAREGAEVVIMDWLREEGLAAVDSINRAGGKALFVYGDIASAEDCERMVREAVARFGKIDYAVLNAGVMDAVYSGEPFRFDSAQIRLMPAQITSATDEYWEGVMRVNASGTFRSMRAVLRQMMKQGRGGAVVVVSSIAGLTGLAGNPAYVASKHAVNGLVRSAAIDCAPYGIRVNSVNMAQTYTPMVERAEEFVAAKKRAGEGFGMGSIKTMSLLTYTDSGHRASYPWEQASTMLYLVSDEASAITGSVIATDGGWTDF